jgi:excisionase family DNA binding protein
MPAPANSHRPPPTSRSSRPGRGADKGAEPAEPAATAALFVRIPTEHARRLDRAAFALRVHKQTLVSELVDRYVNPDSAASLVALADGWGRGAEGEPRGAGAAAAATAADADLLGASTVQGTRVGRLDAAETGDGGRRRVTVETLDQGELTLGRHSFHPRDPEVLTSEEAAELLQVDPEVVLELARAGELPGRELRGEWRFARAALLAWLATGTADRATKG